MRRLNTRSVSNKGTIKIANAIAGADSNGKLTSGLAATAINFIAKIEFNNHINNEPVSPINIFAGEKL